MPRLMAGTINMISKEYLMNDMTDKTGPSISTIQFTNEERDSRKCDNNKLLEAARVLNNDGVVILGNILPEQFIKQFHSEYVNRNKRFFKDGWYAEALPVGNK